MSAFPLPSLPPRLALPRPPAPRRAPPASRAPPPGCSRRGPAPPLPRVSGRGPRERPASWARHSGRRRRLTSTGSRCHGARPAAPRRGREWGREGRTEGREGRAARRAGLAVGRHGGGCASAATEPSGDRGLRGSCGGVPGWAERLSGPTALGSGVRAGTGLPQRPLHCRATQSSSAAVYVLLLLL